MPCGHPGMTQVQCGGANPCTEQKFHPQTNSPVYPGAQERNLINVQESVTAVVRKLFYSLN